MSRFVTDHPQVLTEGEWHHRLGVERRDVGSGMSAGEVESLGDRIDTTALRGYARDVADRTRAVAGSRRRRPGTRSSRRSGSAASWRPRRS